MLITVTCPEGVAPHDILTIPYVGSSGQSVEVTVQLPVGIQPGEQFEVDVDEPAEDGIEEMLRTAEQIESKFAAKNGRPKTRRSSSSSSSLTPNASARSGPRPRASSRKKRSSAGDGPRDNAKLAQKWKVEAEASELECQRMQQAMAEMMSRTESIVTHLKSQLRDARAEAETQGTRVIGLQREMHVSNETAAAQLGAVEKQAELQTAEATEALRAAELATKVERSSMVEATAQITAEHRAQVAALEAAAAERHAAAEQNAANAAQEAKAEYTKTIHITEQQAVEAANLAEEQQAEAGAMAALRIAEAEAAAADQLAEARELAEQQESQRKARGLERVIARFCQSTLSCTFSRWRDWYGSQRYQRNIIKRVTARMRRDGLMKMIDRWCQYCSDVRMEAIQTDAHDEAERRVAAAEVAAADSIAAANRAAEAAVAAAELTARNAAADLERVKQTATMEKEASALRTKAAEDAAKAEARREVAVAEVSAAASVQSAEAAAQHAVAELEKCKASHIVELEQAVLRSKSQEQAVVADIEAKAERDVQAASHSLAMLKASQEQAQARWEMEQKLNAERAAQELEQVRNTAQARVKLEADQAAQELERVRTAASQEAASGVAAADEQARQRLWDADEEARKRLSEATLKSSTELRELQTAHAAEIAKVQAAAQAEMVQALERASSQASDQVKQAVEAHSKAAQRDAALKQNLANALSREESETRELRVNLQSHQAACRIQSGYRRHRSQKYMKQAARTYQDLLKVQTQAADHTLERSVAKAKKETTDQMMSELTAAKEEMTQRLTRVQYEHSMHMDQLAAEASAAIRRERSRPLDMSPLSVRSMETGIDSHRDAGLASPFLDESPRQVRIHELVLREAKAQEQLAIATAIAEEQALQLKASLKHVADFTEATDTHLSHHKAAAIIQRHFHGHRSKQNIRMVVRALGENQEVVSQLRAEHAAAMENASSVHRAQVEGLQRSVVAEQAELSNCKTSLSAAHDEASAARDTHVDEIEALRRSHALSLEQATLAHAEQMQATSQAVHESVSEIEQHRAETAAARSELASLHDEHAAQVTRLQTSLQAERQRHMQQVEDERLRTSRAEALCAGLRETHAEELRRHILASQSAAAASALAASQSSDELQSAHAASLAALQRAKAEEQTVAHRRASEVSELQALLRKNAEELSQLKLANASLRDENEAMRSGHATDVERSRTTSAAEVQRVHVEEQAAAKANATLRAELATALDESAELQAVHAHETAEILSSASSEHKCLAELHAAPVATLQAEHGEALAEIGRVSLHATEASRLKEELATQRESHEQQLRLLRVEKEAAEEAAESQIRIEQEALQAKPRLRYEARESQSVKLRLDECKLSDLALQLVEHASEMIDDRHARWQGHLLVAAGRVSLTATVCGGGGGGGDTDATDGIDTVETYKREPVVKTEILSPDQDVEKESKVTVMPDSTSSTTETLDLAAALQLDATVGRPAPVVESPAPKALSEATRPSVSAALGDLCVTKELHQTSTGFGMVLSDTLQVVGLASRSVAEAAQVPLFGHIVEAHGQLVRNKRDLAQIVTAGGVDPVSFVFLLPTKSQDASLVSKITNELELARAAHVEEVKRISAQRQSATFENEELRTQLKHLTANNAQTEQMEQQALELLQALQTNSRQVHISSHQADLAKGKHKLLETIQSLRAQNEHQDKECFDAMQDVTATSRAVEGEAIALQEALFNYSVAAQELEQASTDMHSFANQVDKVLDETHKALLETHEWKDLAERLSDDLITSRAREQYAKADSLAATEIESTSQFHLQIQEDLAEECRSLAVAADSAATMASKHSAAAIIQGKYHRWHNRRQQNEMSATYHRLLHNMRAELELLSQTSEGDLSHHLAHQVQELLAEQEVLVSEKHDLLARVEAQIQHSQPGRYDALVSEATEEQRAAAMTREEQVQEEHREHMSSLETEMESLRAEHSSTVSSHAEAVAEMTQLREEHAAELESVRAKHGSETAEDVLRAATEEYKGMVDAVRITSQEAVVESMRTAEDTIVAMEAVLNSSIVETAIAEFQNSADPAQPLKFQGLRQHMDMLEELEAELEKECKASSLYRLEIARLQDELHEMSESVSAKDKQIAELHTDATLNIPSDIEALSERSEAEQMQLLVALDRVDTDFQANKGTLRHLRVEHEMLQETVSVEGSREASELLQKLMLERDELVEKLKRHELESSELRNIHVELQAEHEQLRQQMESVQANRGNDLAANHVSNDSATQECTDLDRLDTGTVEDATFTQSSSMAKPPEHDADTDGAPTSVSGSSKEELPVNLACDTAPPAIAQESLHVIEEDNNHQTDGNDNTASVPATNTRKKKFTSDALVSSPSSLAVKYKVLTKCTVRAGKGGNSEKIGEYQKGQVLEVVEESTNKLGLVVVRTTTPPNGVDTGGWVKVRTNKGKVLLEKMQAARSNRRMSISQSDMQRAQLQGIELVQEELIDLVISGTGPLGLRFAHAKGSDANSLDVSIEVKHIVPGSIASAIPDLSVGQVLRTVDGQEVGSYNQTMKIIGEHWRSQEEMTLSLVNPAEDSEEEHEDDIAEDSREGEDTVSAQMETEVSDTDENSDDEHANGAEDVRSSSVLSAVESDEQSTASLDTDHSARSRRAAIQPHQQDTLSPLPAAPSTRISKGPAGRRASVSEVGVGEVGSLAEGIAAELGAIREKVFVVNQEFIKKARPLCELKVGGMGLVLLDGPKVLDTLLYQTISSWQYISSGVKFDLKPGTSHHSKYGKNLFFGTSEGKEMCELMNSHAVQICQAKVSGGPRVAPLAADQAEQQNRQLEQLGPVKNWRATLMKPTKFMLCNQDGTPKHTRWVWCKPDKCGIVWSKAANGSGKVRTLKSVMLGFAEQGGGVSHSTLGFTIVTSQGDEVKLIADDAAQRRQWTASCQAMLQASEASNTAAVSATAAAAARAVYVNHVSAWLKGRQLAKYFDEVLRAFDNAKLAPREWVAMLEDMAADDGLEEFIQSIARTAGDQDQEVVAQQEQSDAGTGTEEHSTASDDYFAEQVDELERLAEEMQSLDDDGEEDELSTLQRQMDELEGTSAAESSADNSLIAGLEELLE